MDEPKKSFYQRNASRLNLGLIILILIVNGYTLLSPLLPQLDLWKRKHDTAAVAGLPYATKLDKTSDKAAKRASIPPDNRLVIPAIALDAHIYTGTASYLINKGVWARPATSTPVKGSNTVLVAHRFNYTGASNFYSLNKMKSGDKVVVYWQGKEYDYTVSSNQVLDDTDLAVESPTKKPQLTLYTCTPVWDLHPKYRIVVTASLDGSQG